MAPKLHRMLYATDLSADSIDAIRYAINYAIKHKAKLSTDVDSRVVAAPHGWWYGYKDGWKEVNINVLTEGKVYDRDVGSGVLKGLLCQVRKTESPPVEI